MAKFYGSGVGFGGGGENQPPTNPTDDFPNINESTTITHTFTGSSDPDGSVTQHLVDTISSGTLTVDTAEVAAGVAHSFTTGSVDANTDITFRVRAKDNEGKYSSGITITTTVIEVPVFQGTTYGYDAGGRLPTLTDVIQKYAFTSDGSASDVANLVSARDGLGGTNSKTYGYAHSGRTANNAIDKHQFATTNNATTVGTLYTDAYIPGGITGDDNYGYCYCGKEPGSNVIQRYPYASDTNSTDVGDSTAGRNGPGACSDWVASYGFGLSGYNTNVIDRFAFASSSNASDVGDMGVITEAGASPSATAYGYYCGGYGGGVKDHIQKVQFTSSASSADVANMYQGRYNVDGSSSTTHGYMAGGNYSTGTAYTSQIDKFPFASDTNATSVGYLIHSVTDSTGFHV